MPQKRSRLRKLNLAVSKLPVIELNLMIGSSSFHNSFIPELGQHLQHVDADLLRIIIQTGADDAETVRRQDAAMQLVGLILLILLIFFIRYLLHAKLTPLVSNLPCCLSNLPCS